MSVTWDLGTLVDCEPLTDNPRFESCIHLLQANTEAMAVVVAQLVEHSLPIPEVFGSNPVIGKHLYWTFTVNCNEKVKIKKKRLGMAHLFEKNTDAIGCGKYYVNFQPIKVTDPKIVIQFLCLFNARQNPPKRGCSDPYVLVISISFKPQKPHRQSTA